jgi:hypothetical protein
MSWNRIIIFLGGSTEDIEMAIHRSARTGLVLLFAALMSGAAIAQSREANLMPRQGDMGYLNGSFGEEQADQMRDMTSLFPVRFTFARHDGTHNIDVFVADVHLRIVDSQGRTVLELTQQGPIFLLRLPDGAYAIEAERNGEVKTRRFEIVAGRRQHIALSWAG